MFIHNLNPILLKLGPVEIRWYGVIFVFGFLLSMWWLDWMRRKGRAGLTKDDVSDLIVYILVGVVIGARLFEVFVWNPGYYLSNPVRAVMVWQGGLSFHGGLIGALIAGWLFCKKKNKDFLHLADILVIPAAFGLALGRIANFINGELFGIVANVPWCVKFPAAGGCRHPVQIYGAVGRLFLSFYLLMLSRKERKRGFILLGFILLMGIGRFFLDFLREDARFLGLSTGQYLSVFMVIVAGYLLLRYYKNELREFPF